MNAVRGDRSVSSNKNAHLIILPTETVEISSTSGSISPAYHQEGPFAPYNISRRVIHPLVPDQ
jgi:hypothetical protein